MSKKAVIKRMSRHLINAGLPPDAPGVAKVLERVGARPRTLVRAMYRLDQKRVRRTGERPRYRQAPRGMLFNIKTGRFIAHAGWRAIVW